MKKIILLALIGSVIASAGNSEWIFISKDKNSSTYLNMHRLSIDGTNIKFWWKVEYKDGSSAKYYEELSCKEDKTRSLSKVVYDKDGVTTFSDNSIYPWGIIVPESLGDIFGDVLCGYYGIRSKEEIEAKHK